MPDNVLDLKVIRSSSAKGSFIDPTFRLTFRLYSKPENLAGFRLCLKNLNKPQSPQINSAKWGEIAIGKNIYKDVKCFPGGNREWNWKETGTRHIPGIQISDIKELISHGSEIIILTQGYNKKLEVKPETIDFCKNEKVEYYILDTEKAVIRYNDFVKNGKLVGGVFHSTC